MSSPPDLQAIREEIEAIDREIMAQLARRMKIVEAVADSKLESAYPFRDKLREEQVLARVRQAAADHGLDPHEIERLYRQIMEMSVAHQQAHVRSLATAPLRVTYQGVEGSYSHLTAQRLYAGRKGGVLLGGWETFRGAADAVRRGESDRALLPIENTTAGTIAETYDLLAEGGLVITAEVVSLIEHCLLALPGTRLEDLRTVISHPQALRQCEEFLGSVPWIQPQAEYDTAGSARKVRERNDPRVAAIASSTAAQAFGLEVLRRGIQSQRDNYTRFVELAPEPAACPAGVPCKTSLLFVLPHHPGALAEVLSRLGERGVNVVRIESRPLPANPWQYRFFVDLEGHAASEPIAASLDAIGPLTTELRLLGTYPKAAPPG